MTAFNSYMDAVAEAQKGKQAFVALTHEEAAKLGAVRDGRSVKELVIPISATLAAMGLIIAYGGSPLSAEKHLFGLAVALCVGALIGSAVTLILSKGLNNIGIAQTIIETKLRPIERILGLPALNDEEVARRNLVTTQMPSNKVQQTPKPSGPKIRQKDF